MLDKEVVIISGIRSAIGTFEGGFKDLPASELGAQVIKTAIEKAGIQAEDVDEVIMGCVGQIGEDAFIARTSALKAGLPVTVTAHTVNRLCSSGLQAIVSAAQSIRSGDTEVAVAGGVENMTRIPYLNRNERFGSRMGDTVLEDALISMLTCPFGQYHMGITAENVAARYGITREEQDIFAYQSQQKMAKAMAEGKFVNEIMPIYIKQRKGEDKVVNVDEHPRPETTLEKLAKLKPAFKQDGTVTAGNSSGINDGAAAVVVTSWEKAQKLNVKPILRIVAAAASGVEPEVMGIGPVPAIRKVLNKSGLKIEDIDLIELNEAFASQSVAVCKELNLDMNRVNVNGGAIAHGHPIGATGCILTVKLISEMQRRKSRYGMVSLCIGGGQGLAVIFERL